MPPSQSSPSSPVVPPRPIPQPRKTRVSSIHLPSPEAALHHRAALSSAWLSPRQQQNGHPTFNHHHLSDSAAFGQTLPIMNSIHNTPSPSTASNSPTSGLMPQFISVSPNDPATPTVCGLPLKYVSLFTLAIQNALLTIIMHYSRVSTPPSQAYSAASAVLVNELLKGGISLAIALMRIDSEMSRTTFDANGVPHTPITKSKKLSNGGPIVLTSGAPLSFTRIMQIMSPARWHLRLRRLRREIFSSDCWKLSIPAILYVIQNNLQFVAASNLDVATFQVTYQMKILTTAAFSVMLLRRKLSATKWLALFFLAIGVGIVQIQSGAGKPHAAPPPPPSFAAEGIDEGELPNVGDLLAAPTHTMHPLTGFLAVCAACMTSGLAGVYFEMVLKNSQADLWVRNVQLSLFSLIPAIVPIIFTAEAGYPGQGWLGRLFRNFTPWAWATVLTQVAGGLVTAIVIKHADNILKGFATSLSIILSFLASVLLFGFTITPAFVVGSTTVLGATWMYNQPAPKGSADGSTISLLSAGSSDSRRPSFPGSPVSPDAPILGQMPKQRSPYASPSSLALALGITSSTTASRPTSGLPSPLERDYFGASAVPPLYSSPPSRPPSRPPSTKPPTRPPSRPPSTRPSREGSRSGSGDELQNVDLGTVEGHQYRRPPPIDTGLGSGSHLLVPPPLSVEGNAETTKLIRR